MALYNNAIIFLFGVMHFCVKHTSVSLYDAINLGSDKSSNAKKHQIRQSEMDEPVHTVKTHWYNKGCLNAKEM